MIRVLMIAALLMISTVTQATPSVFVHDEPGMAWWTRQMEVRIVGKTAGTVTVKQLSTYLEETMIYSSYSVCALEAIQSDTFVGINRKTQTEIDQYRAHVSWRQEGITPDGRKVLGQSVVFEACDPDAPRGAALLVTDQTTGEILRWEPIGERIREGSKSFPAWVLFLSPRADDELFSYSGCTECDASTNVYYDVTRKKIYVE